MPLSINKGTLVNDKKEDRFNKVYGSDGEPGSFCDMEDHEDTKYFHDYTLPNVFPPDDGRIFSVYEGN